MSTLQAGRKHNDLYLCPDLENNYGKHTGCVVVVPKSSETYQKQQFPPHSLPATLLR